MDLRRFGYPSATSNHQQLSSEQTSIPAAPLFSLSNRAQNTSIPPSSANRTKSNTSKIFSLPTRSQALHQNANARQAYGSSSKRLSSIPGASQILSSVPNFNPTIGSQHSLPMGGERSSNTHQLTEATPLSFHLLGKPENPSLNDNFALGEPITEPSDLSLSQSDAHIPNSKRNSLTPMHFSAPLDVNSFHRPQSRSESRCSTSSQLAQANLNSLHDGDADIFEQAMLQGRSQLQSAKAELNLKRKEASDLENRLHTIMSEHRTSIETLKREIDELKHAHERERTRDQERYETDIQRLKDQAKSDIEAAKAQVCQSREEILAIKSVAEMHEKRAQEEVVTSNSKVETAQQLTRKLIEESKRRHSELHASFVELDRKYQSLQATMLEGAKELREAKKLAREGLEFVQPLVSDDGVYIKSQETKALLNELQEDRNNSQQVNCLLRNKLSNVLSELAEARERIRELETKQLQEADRLRLYTHKLGDITQRFSTLSEALRAREREAIDSLATAQGFEQRLDNSQAQLNKAVYDLNAKSKELEDLKSVRSENAVLKAKLDDATLAIEASLKKDAKLSASESRVVSLECSLSNVQEKLEASDSSLVSIQTLQRQTALSLSSSEAQVCELRLQLESTSGELARLKEDHELLQGKLETVTSIHKSEVQALQDLTRQTQLHERAAMAKCEQANSQVVALQSSLDATKAALESTTLSLNKVNVKNAALEGRFEDQRDTLRMTKADLGDLHERLLAAEKTYSAQLSAIERNNLERVTLLEKTHANKINAADKAHTAQVHLLEESHLEALKALEKKHAEQLSSLEKLYAERLDSQTQAHNEKLIATERTHLTQVAAQSEERNIEVAVLKEQRCNLEQKLADTLQDSKRQQDAFIGASIEFERKMKSQEAMFRELVKAQEIRAETAERSAGNAEQQAASAELRAISAERQADTAKQNAASVDRDGAKALLALKKTNEQLTMALKAAQERADQMQGPSSKAEEQANAAQLHIAELNDVIAGLKYKASTLYERSRGGQLDDDEKVFVGSLLNMSRSIHEGELVEKTNELRRREYVNSTLQEKISKLESKLARLLRAEPHEDEIVQGPDASMINLTNWVHSSSDPNISVDKGPEALPETLMATEVSTAQYISPMLAQGSGTGLTKDSIIEGPYDSLADNSKETTEAGSSSRPKTYRKSKPAKGSDNAAADSIASSDPPSNLPRTPSKTFAQIADSELSDEIEDLSDDEDYVPLAQQTSAAKQGIKRRRVPNPEPVPLLGPSTPAPKAPTRTTRRSKNGNRKPQPGAGANKSAGASKAKNQKR